VEVDARLGPENPFGGAYVVTETPLSTESEAQRTVDPFRSRYWKVINEKRLNRMGKPVGCNLVPGHTTYPLALPESSMGKRATFMYRHLWVTPFAPAERYPAGDFPFQHPGGAGLPAWTSGNRATRDADVVVWHVFGTNHVPRLEDWPVMPVEKTGFHLKPVGFFDRNPAHEVPPSRRRHCHREPESPPNLAGE
jgi:primary-amine oxidase